METVISVNGLSKSFKLSPKQQKIQKKTKVIHAVEDLSFAVSKGEIFGLLGPNGAGKTTTLRMLATLIAPDKGEAILDGAGIVAQPREVRKKIAFLTSELKLEEFFTPDYLYDFFSDLHGVEKEQKELRKKDIFERFGIDKFAQVKVANLSTGMKQKASLAISLVHDPDIIIFDEPTNGLDVLTAKVVTDYLLELKDRGKTIIVSTHIFSLVEKICDTVGIIIDGEMAAWGSLDEVRAGMSLEDRFFEIYSKKVGEAQ